MDRSKWRVAGVTVVGTVALIWGMSWFVAQLNPDTDPGSLAYKPVENMPPRVDLAAVQRSWPNSLDQPGDRRKLVAYQHDMEGSAPVPVAKPAAAAAPVDLGTLLASADPNAGKAKVQVCGSCHDLTQGGPNRIGPNLWGVVGRHIGSHLGFAYSPAMSSQSGAWTYEKLFAYLASPAREVPGNKMGFAGMSKPEDRAAVIKYLATLGGTATPPAPTAQGAGAAGGKAR
jgi:cytochrome c